VSKLEYRALLSVDVQKSSARGRLPGNNIRKVLREAVADSLARNNISWADCFIHDLGDGLTVIAPPGTAKADLLNTVIYDLALRLRQHNYAEGAGSRKLIRVRAALHAGEVEVSDDGAVTGRPFEVLARLLDTAELRAALGTAPADTPLALIMSGHYYEDAVKYGSLSVLPEDFASRQVGVKEFEGEAWLFVPAFAARTARAARPQSSQPQSSQPQSSQPQPQPEPDGRPADHLGGTVPTTLDVDVLAAAGATALVTAMATDSWSGLKKVIQALFVRIGTDRAQAAQDRLESDARLVEGARDPETARQALLGPWVSELGALLRSAPGSDEELGALLRAYRESGRSGRHGQASVVVDQTTIVGNGATAMVVGVGDVIQIGIPAPHPPIPASGETEAVST
jgi:class 3 adenylate cyclase